MTEIMIIYFWQGLPRFLARDKVLDILTDKKLLVSVTDHDMVLPVCR